MKNTLKRVNGIYYANGKEFKTFAEAIRFIFKDRKEVKK